GIAHEVNNPLGIVLMYANLILEEVSEKSEMKKDLELIVEQANRCKKIVSGLLHFARQNKTLKKSTDVKVLVDNYVKFIPGNGKIKVTVNHELNDCKADIDGDQIIQVLTNLTSNAIAAMPEGGELIIKTKESGRKIIIEVEDTGTGIPLEHQGRIFDPFFTTKQIGKGTGLGLAVSYGIVKMHKGDIRFETNSDKSKGPTWTRFMVELPRKEEE
ncbi:MAG: histidine kinase, partial [uncultured bacterium]